MQMMKKEEKYKTLKCNANLERKTEILVLMPAESLMK